MCFLPASHGLLTRAYAALLWFDWALTFPTEYQRIWRRRFSGATIIYILTRYTALIDTIFSILETLDWSLDDAVCVHGRLTHIVIAL